MYFNSIYTIKVYILKRQALNLLTFINCHSLAKGILELSILAESTVAVQYLKPHSLF
jgi:hypothetical protein